MKIGLVGLGRMGMAIAYRLLQAKHEVIGFDPVAESMQHLIQMGGDKAESLADLACRARVIWIMVPAGEPVDKVIEGMRFLLKPQDVLIDGGNSHYRDTRHRAEKLKESDIYFLDCGTSGGIRGKELGFSLMIGGDVFAYKKIEQLFSAIAAPSGYAYLGPSGSGHYVKMVHNGIEYALLQSYAEGYNLLRHGACKDLDLASIAHVWQHGSIIRSFINELCEQVLQKDQYFEQVSGAVGENFTGKWTVEEAQKYHIPVDLIERAVSIRAWSRTTGGNYATKFVSLLRNVFGGHSFEKTHKNS